MDDAEFEEVSSEDDGNESMLTVIDNMVKKIKAAPDEQIDKLGKLNDELMKNCSQPVDEPVKPNEVD